MAPLFGVAFQNPQSQPTSTVTMGDYSRIMDRYLVPTLYTTKGAGSCLVANTASADTDCLCGQCKQLFNTSPAHHPVNRVGISLSGALLGHGVVIRAIRVVYFTSLSIHSVTLQPRLSIGKTMWKTRNSDLSINIIISSIHPHCTLSFNLALD